MKDEPKKVMAKGMGLAEVSRISVPKKFRRKAWRKEEFVYWKLADEPDDNNFYLTNQDDDSYYLSDADLFATDWEIVK